MGRRVSFGRMNPGLSFERFRDLARSSRLVPVWAELLFDVDTAVTAYARLVRPPWGFLLESVVGGERWARYSFLGTDPAAAWRLHGGRATWWTRDGGWQPVDTADPLADLSRRLAAYQPADVPELPRFWGGAVGYLGYDVVRQLERLPNAPPDGLDIPDAVFMFTDVVLAIDNLLGRANVIAAVPVEPGIGEEELRARYERGLRKVAAIIHSLRTAPAPPPMELLPEPAADPEFESSMSRKEFERAVQTVRDYIFAGDAFQVVLSQRLEMSLAGSPFELYRVLRTLNPSPYLYFVELDGVTLVGSSPELLVRVEDGVVTVRPIAGTRPRGATPEEDARLAGELAADEKELAEHRMLVDLGRNDVGRVARSGTVRVSELMAVERYSHVMHIVSRVEGDLREGLTALDALLAGFPAGTLSGAPKVRAMEIIDELEPVRRGPYGGAVGYLAYGGRTMDTAIAIRTLLATRGKAYVQAGAGVVADSDPAAEYEETLNKARALLRAGTMISGADSDG